jgi:hemolysin activation/secretion protein
LNFTYAGVVPTRELTYWAANYRAVLTAEGLAAFADASYGYGHPGTAQLDLLQYKTTTLYGDAGFSYPVIRTREKNLTLSGLFFTSDSISDIFNFPLNKDFIRGTRVKADADMADAWHGINQFNVTVSQGINGLGSSPNNNPMGSRTSGRVDFTKVEGTASRTQSLFGPVSLYLSGYGQYSTTSLLSPEQCSFGGRFFGRAFDPSQLLADSCYMGTFELRYGLPVFWQVSQAQLYAFTDGAEMYDRGSSILMPSMNFHAASAGGGLRLGWLSYMNADLTVAKAIDGPRDDTRFFFAVTGKY